MKIKHYLAIDLGATSGRSILATFDGQSVSMREVARFANPMIPMREHICWDLPALLNNILDSMKSIAKEGIELTSIGIDTWGRDFAIFGRDGQLLGLPYCYRDSHTRGSMERLFERMPAAEVYERTGIQFMEFNSLFQLDTLRHNGSSALSIADKILFIPDALGYMLTGEAVTEKTVASTSQILNAHTGLLDEDLLSLIGLTHEQFGKQVEPATVIGTLTPEIQRHTGLGAVPVVAVAGHDTASAVVAIPSESNDFAYLSCGTWSLLGIESPKPIINEESFKQNFTNEGGIDNTIRFLKNICGLWIFERCRSEWSDAPSSVAELVESALTTSFDSLINPDAPCFANPESMTRAITDYCVKTGQQAPQTYAEYCRLIFRSLALRYRQVLSLLDGFASNPIAHLNVIGGGSQNKILMQFTANAIGRKVIAGPAECTALGNVLIQMRASGDCNTSGEIRKIASQSTATAVYTPTEAEIWEAAYAQFIAIQQLENN